MKLNRNEIARLQQIRDWVKTEKETEGLMLKDPFISKLMAAGPIAEAFTKITVGRSNVEWLLKVLDREAGRQATLLRRHEP